MPAERINKFEWNDLTDLIDCVMLSQVIINLNHVLIQKGDHRLDISDDPAIVNMNFQRMETQEEADERVASHERCRQLAEARERVQYEELKRKFAASEG